MCAKYAGAMSSLNMSHSVRLTCLTTRRRSAERSKEAPLLPPLAAHASERERECTKSRWLPQYSSRSAWKCTAQMAVTENLAGEAGDSSAKVWSTSQATPHCSSCAGDSPRCTPKLPATRAASAASSAATAAAAASACAAACAAAARGSTCGVAVAPASRYAPGVAGGVTSAAPSPSSAMPAPARDVG